MLFLKKEEIKDFDSLEEFLTLPNPAHNQYVNPQYSGNIPPTITYIYSNDSGDQFAVPRNIPSRFYKNVECKDLTTDVPVPSIKFTQKLRSYQEEFFQNFEADTYEDSIYEVSCGLGKTVMALYTLSKLKQRAVILVPTNKLMEQWYEEASFFLSGVKVGLSDKKVETSHKEFDVLILSLDLARERKLDSEFFSTFGVSVWDELHRTGAQSYLPLIEKCPTRYRIGLSATFRREDNHHRILLQHFGNLFTMRYSGRRADVFALDMKSIKYDTAFKGKLTKAEHALFSARTKVHSTKGYFGFENSKSILFSANQRWTKKITRFLSQPSFPALYSLSTSITRRNRIVASTLENLLSQGRSVLVLSKRKDILKQYHEQFSKKYSSVLVISETSKDATQLKAQDTAQIIFGISQIAEYGFNVPHLDTLVLLHPLKDTEQAIGRILRKHENKKSPVAIIVTDNNLSLRKLVQKSAKEFIPFNGSFRGFYTPKKLCEKIRTLTP